MYHMAGMECIYMYDAEMSSLFMPNVRCFMFFLLPKFAAFCIRHLPEHTKSGQESHECSYVYTFDVFAQETYQYFPACEKERDVCMGMCVGEKSNKIACSLKRRKA